MVLFQHSSSFGALVQSLYRNVHIADLPMMRGSPHNLLYPESPRPQLCDDGNINVYSYPEESSQDRPDHKKLDGFE